MSAVQDGLPTPPHLASEFYVWLWWASETREAKFSLGEQGEIELWVDERLAFRLPSDTKISAVMTGENPSTSLESRAALVGGKVLQDVRVRFRRDDREFSVTLKGPEMHIQRAKFPQNVDGGGEEALYDRMFLYEELCFVIATLFQEFATLRTTGAWADEILPAMQAWSQGVPSGD